MSTNSEKLNSNEEYSDRAFSSHILGFKYCRVYSASEARLSSNSTLSFPKKITFDNTLGTTYVVWDVLNDVHSGDSSINIRLAYDNTEMCRPSCELEIEIDGIRIGPAIRLEATHRWLNIQIRYQYTFLVTRNFKIAIHARNQIQVGR